MPPQSEWVIERKGGTQPSQGDWSVEPRRSTSPTVYPETAPVPPGTIQSEAAVLKADTPWQRRIRDFLSTLPTIGGTVGGIVGGVGGTATGTGIAPGPGTVAGGLGGMVTGGMAGQMGGEAIRQMVADTIYGERMEPAEAISSVNREGVIGGASELAGGALAPVARTFSRSAARSYEKLLRPVGEASDEVLERIQNVAPQMVEQTKQDASTFVSRSRNALEKRARGMMRLISPERRAAEKQIIANERAGKGSQINWQAVLSDLQGMRAELNMPSTGKTLVGKEPAANYLDEVINELEGVVQTHIRPRTTRPVRGYLGPGATQLPAPEGGVAYTPSGETFSNIVSRAQESGGRIVYTKNPETGQLSFFSKPALEGGEHQTTLWGPEFIGTEKEAAELIQTYNAQPANLTEVEELRRVMMGSPGPQSTPVGRRADAAFLRDVATGKIKPEKDERVLGRLSEHFETYQGAPSAEDLIHIRRVLDRTWRSNPPAEQFKKEIESEYADSLRREINSAHPNLAKIYANSHMWQTVLDSLKNQRLKEVGKPMSEKLSSYITRSGLTLAASGGGGTYFGGFGGGIGALTAAAALDHAVSTAAWRTTSSALKSQAAKLLSRSDFKGATILLNRIAASKATAPSTPQAPKTPPSSSTPALQNLLQRR